MHIARDVEQEFVLESELAVGVLGNGEDFVLVHLNDAPLDASVLAQATAKGFAWCGVMGIRHGKPEVRISPDNAEAVYTMCFAGLAYAHLVAEHFKPQPKTDAVEWLTRLHALPDTRGHGPN